jgi:pimeloyl-ACP methyl ester carboxylesterase
MNEPSFVNTQTGKYAEANGLHMYYEVHGVGIPVILLHGGLETCQMWAPVIPSLSTHYQVITPDSRAHGRTNNPSGRLSFSLMAEDTALFIQALGLQKPFIVGYSNGGQVALHMAMAYPGLARGYMLGGIFNSMTDAWRQMMQGPLGFEGPGMVNFEHITQSNPDLIQAMQEKHDRFHAPGYWKTLLAQASQCWWAPPIHAPTNFAKIVDPALFWCGDRDVFCPPEQSLEMYKMVTKAELAVIPNADHFSMLQQFDIATKILLNFMTRMIKSE